MSATSLKALVIDDQHSMRSILLALLRKLNITQVKEAENGERAVEMLLKDSEKPDFILCDLYMDKGGGIDFINQIRRQDALKNLNIPVILLTGESDPMILNVGRQVGAAAILKKPCSLNELAKTIGGVVGFDLTPGSSIRADA